MLNITILIPIIYIHISIISIYPNTNGKVKGIDGFKGVYKEIPANLLKSGLSIALIMVAFSKAVANYLLKNKYFIHYKKGKLSK